MRTWTVLAGGMMAAWVSGCAGAPEPLPTAYDVHVSTSWAQDVTVDGVNEGGKMAIALQVLDDWHAAVGVTFNVTVSDDPCSGACFQLALVSHDQVAAEATNEAAEGVDFPGTAAYVSNDFDDEWTARIARHEVGHALGLSHIQDTSAVMYPVLAQEAAQIGPLDVAAYWTLRGR